MIDPTLRNRRIILGGADPTTAVILLDIVLGYGAAPRPGRRGGGGDPRGAADRGGGWPSHSVFVAVRLRHRGRSAAVEPARGEAARTPASSCCPTTPPRPAGRALVDTGVARVRAGERAIGRVSERRDRIPPLRHTPILLLAFRGASTIKSTTISRPSSPASSRRVASIGRRCDRRWMPNSQV